MVDTFIDAGPLIAVLSRTDRYHVSCAALIRALNCAFYTSMPVLTEAMYFLAQIRGYSAQEALWRMVLRGDLLVQHETAEDLARMSALMQKYQDRPMDFADASLVSLAERLSIERIFTLDRSDFSVYRMKRNRAFTVIGPS
jgi:uncharacterized protein